MTRTRNTTAVDKMLIACSSKMYEGHLINKLQNSVILLVFKNIKIPNIFCKEFNSEFQL